MAGAPDIGMGSVLILPLLARGRTLGVLVLGRGVGRTFAPRDLALADDLAGRGAVALDNARLYQNIQEGDRRKNEFLAMLAHELRNPLAPIRNAVQVLRLIGLKEPNICQARDMIDRQVTHMARLIDDLLDMSGCRAARSCSARNGSIWCSSSAPSSTTTAACSKATV